MMFGKGRGRRMLSRAFACCIVLSSGVLSAQPIGGGTEQATAARPETEIAATATPDENGIPRLIPTEAFTSRNALFDAQISPDGSAFAYQIHDDGRTRIAILDADTKKTLQIVDMGERGRMVWFRWAGNRRLIYSTRSFQSIIQLFVPTTRLMVFDLDTRKASFVGLPNQGSKGDTVIYTDPAGQFVLLSLVEKGSYGPSVFRFQLDGTGETTAQLVEARKSGIDEWWADNDGVVRLGMQRVGSKKAAFHYRSRAGQPLVQIAKLRRDDQAFDAWDVLSIRSGSDTGYALVEDKRGLNVLHKFDYRTGLAGEVVYASDTWSIEDAVFDSQGLLTGASFTDDFPRTHWLDPDIARTQERLESALGEGRVRIVSRSDSGRMLVWHGGAHDPGVLYIYTPAQSRLETYAELRPELDFKQLASPKASEYLARDGTRIRAYVTLPKGREAKALPLIIMPHGGPYGIRDTLAFNDDVQLLANRGYAVVQPNYRGSGGYGEAFEKLGDGQIGRKMQDDLDDAMDWAVAQGFADPRRVCVVGSSYGGFAAMWAVIRNPERYRCAASWAGVTDFEAQLKFDRSYFSRRNARRWQERIEGTERPFTLDDVSPAKQAARLTRPLLIAHGKRDRVVPFSQFTMMRDALKKAGISRDLYRTLAIEDEGHSFAERDNETLWSDALLRFLANRNPSDVNVPGLYPPDAPDPEEVEEKKETDTEQETGAATDTDRGSDDSGLSAPPTPEEAIAPQPSER